VLLLGETGSGKTHLAALIHALGTRCGRPFLSVNCGAIPDGLFEREMFGHLRGAFTDARESRPGLFEAANGGTLFLDEIAELPLGLQSKLLAVLEEGQVRRIGATSPVRLDVRVIVATNADLAELVAARRFRQDLVHRLAVLRFRVPPLRERRREIPGLAYRLLQTRASGCVPELSAEALRMLQWYPWPGNVRELENALRHALVFAEGRTIEPAHLPPEVAGWTPGAPGGEDGLAARPRYEAPADAGDERRMILEAIRAEGGNRTRAARRLGMSRSALWIKIHRHNLLPDL